MGELKASSRRARPMFFLYIGATPCWTETNFCRTSWTSVKALDIASVKSQRLRGRGVAAHASTSPFMPADLTNSFHILMSKARNDGFPLSSSLLKAWRHVL